MDTIQCAVVLAKLERFDWEIAQRQRLGNHYERRLVGSDLSPVVTRPDRSNVHAQYTVRVRDREAVQTRLRGAGIPTAVHYPVPLNEQPAYRHLCCPDCTPLAARAAKEVMSLPMSADLSVEAQDHVVKLIESITLPSKRHS